MFNQLFSTQYQQSKGLIKFIANIYLSNSLISVVKWTIGFAKKSTERYKKGRIFELLPVRGNVSLFPSLVYYDYVFCEALNALSPSPPSRSLELFRQKHQRQIIVVKISRTRMMWVLHLSDDEMGLRTRKRCTLRLLQTSTEPTSRLFITKWFSVSILVVN